MIRKRFGWFGLGLGILLVGIMTLAVAEFSLRELGFGDPPLYVFDDEIEYYLKPGGAYTRFGQTIRVNRYGMRSDDVDLSHIDRSLVFSLYGDSIVYGPRLDQVETLPALVQRLLRHESPGVMPVANAVAASGWGPENLFYFYNRFGPFPGNTAWVIQSTHDMSEVTHQVNNIVSYRSSTPYGAIHDCTISAWYWIIPRMLPKIPDPESFQEKRRRADIALGALLSALKRDYVRVVLVFHATKEEALSGRADSVQHYRRFAESRNLEFISTLELYGRAYALGRRPHLDEIHLNAFGASLLAEQLLKSLP